MLVRYLDLETGRKAEGRGISEFDLTENNWSCDCNRRIPFEGNSDSETCDGCHRFIVYDVEAEDGDEPFDANKVICEANSEYYMRLRAVMRLFVWTGFCPDYTDGLAFAIAENVEQAQRLVIEAKGYEPFDWGTVQEFPVTEPRAFCVSGGG